MPFIALGINALGVMANMDLIREYMDSAGQAIGVFPAGMLAVLVIALWLIATGLAGPYIFTHITHTAC